MALPDARYPKQSMTRTANLAIDANKRAVVGRATKAMRVRLRWLLFLLGAVSELANLSHW